MKIPTPPPSQHEPGPGLVLAHPLARSWGRTRCVRALVGFGYKRVHASVSVRLRMRGRGIFR